MFIVKQWVGEGCNIVANNYCFLINAMMNELENGRLGIELSKAKMSLTDFVGVRDS